MNGFAGLVRFHTACEDCSSRGSSSVHKIEAPAADFNNCAESTLARRPNNLPRSTRPSFQGAEVYPRRRSSRSPAIPYPEVNDD